LIIDRFGTLVIDWRMTTQGSGHGTPSIQL
jgi:hypothetical protein